MTSREKTRKALNHEGGPIPVDFGSTAVTGMHCTCVAALRDHYGLEQRPVKIHEPYQMLGLMEDDLLDAVGAGVVGMEPLSTMFGFPAADWKEWRTPWGQDVLVPAPFLKAPKGIRDIAEWYVSTAIRQEHVHEIFRRQTDIALANLEKAAPVLGDLVDVVFMCGTDFGTQGGTFCAPSTFDELWLPYYREMNDWIHANTRWKTFKHSCGAVANFMDRFIDAGFDIINPVQCSAAGMDPQTLKDRYGNKLVFWGGGVDTQHVLPFGTPAEVRAQVLERCRIFSRQGGFVFNAIHNVQAKTPVENIGAMLDAVREFNAPPQPRRTARPGR